MASEDNKQADNADINQTRRDDLILNKNKGDSDRVTFKSDDMEGNHSSHHSQSIHEQFNPPQSKPYPMTQASHHTLSKQQEKSLIQYNHASYLLYALSFFTAGLTWIIPIIMNYVRRRDAEGTWLATHFDWQIKTFWYSLIVGGIGTFILMFSMFVLGVGIFSESSNVAISSIIVALIGGLLILWAIFWHLYRIVRGWIALSNHSPIP